MRRLGKKQELKRRFRFFSIVGFVVVLGLTWEFSHTTLVFSLSNGDTAGSLWLVLVVCFGMFFVMLSMAECASMAPTSGETFHDRVADMLETLADFSTFPSQVVNITGSPNSLLPTYNGL